MKKNKLYLISLILLTSCVQDSANIVFKEGDNFTNNEISAKNNLQPSYMSGTYVVGRDNKVVRDIRANNTKDQKEYIKEDIENDIKEKEENKVVDNREYTFITVKKGDNLINLSKKYNMQFSDVVELNNLKRPYNIYVGQKLKVFKNEDKERYTTIKVKSGDTLLRIALEYDMSLREIASINNIKPPYNVYVGQKLKVPYSKTNKPEFYVVKKGDNLYEISRKTDISVRQLIANNNLSSPNNIYPGQKLYLTKKLENKQISYNKKEEKKIKEEKQEIVKEPKQEVVVKQEEPKKQEPVKREVVFSWPVKGEVIKKYGKQNDGKFYDAINIKADLGTSVLASMDGEVAYAGNELKGFGNIIIIKHDSGWLSIYGYCDKINVKVKDKITKGQSIATVGKTGNVNEPQLYFSIRKGRVTMDPLKYLENN